MSTHGDTSIDIDRDINCFSKSNTNIDFIILFEWNVLITYIISFFICDFYVIWFKTIVLAYYSSNENNIVCLKNF